MINCVSGKNKLLKVVVIKLESLIITNLIKQNLHFWLIKFNTIESITLLVFTIIPSKILIKFVINGYLKIHTTILIVYLILF